MWLLIILTATSIVAKVRVARRLWLCRKSHIAFLALVVVLISYAQSILELYGYYRVIQPQGVDMTILLKLYHVMVVAYLVLLSTLIIAVITGKINRYMLTIALVIILPTTIWYMAGDDVVAGSVLLSQAYTRVPGSHYWVFQITVLSALAIGLCIPSWIYFKTDSEIERVKSANIIIGVAIVCFVITALIFLMSAGVKITATGVLPIVLAIYLVIVAECLNDDYIYDLRVYIPWTEKARQIRELTKHFRNISSDKIDTKEMSKLYQEKLLLMAEKNSNIKRCCKLAKHITLKIQSRSCKN